MKRITSLKLDGFVSSMWVIESEADLAHIPDEYTTIGAGSNVIINPKTPNTLIKVSPDFVPITLDQDSVTCSAGASVSQLLKWMSSNNRSALEFAAGVPASIGGMVAMNFECWGIEISTIVESLLVYTKENGLQWLSKSDYKTGYRWTSFHETNAIILAVKLKTIEADNQTVKDEIKKNLDYRKRQQPLLKSTCGSVFKNPLPQKAGQLIEGSGLKGHKQGGIQVSQHHSNFFENIESATYDDIISLIKTVQKEVLTRYNVTLSCEVKIIR